MISWVPILAGLSTFPTQATPPKVKVTKGEEFTYRSEKQ